MVSIEEIARSADLETFRAETTGEMVNAFNKIDLTSVEIESMPKNLDAPGIRDYLENLGVEEIRVLKKKKGDRHLFYGMFTKEVNFPESAYKKNISEYYSPHELAEFFPEEMIKVVNSERKFKKELEYIQEEFAEYVSLDTYEDPRSHDTPPSRIKRFIILTQNRESIKKIVGISVLNFKDQISFRELVLKAEKRKKKE